MTEEQKQKFYELARRSARLDKKDEMEALLAEAQQAYGNKNFTKSYVTSLGIRCMALVRAECMVEFIKQGKAMAKEVDIDL